MLLLFFALAFIAIYSSMWKEPDIYWRLSEAKWMVENHAVIHHNVFSWSSYERISHSWLFDLVVYLLYKVHPVAPPLFLALLFALLFHLCTNKYTVHQKAVAAGIMSFMLWQIGIRANVISSIAIVLLIRYQLKWWQYVLMGILVGNLHGGFTLIVALFGFLLSYKHRAHLWGTPLFLLSSLINPYGYKSIMYSLFAYPQYFVKINSEFVSPLFHMRSVIGILMVLVLVFSLRYIKFNHETLVAIAMWLFSVRFISIMCPLIAINLRKITINKVVGFLFCALAIINTEAIALSDSIYPFPVPQGKLLTHLNYGSYVIYHGQKSFVDTRWDPFDKKTFETFMDLYSGINLEQHIKETKPDYVIWATKSPLTSWLKEKKAKVVYEKNGVSILDVRGVNMIGINNITGIQ